MKMVDENEKWEKLASYFAGNSTEEERLALKQWLDNASESDKQLYYEAEKIWGFTSGAHEEFLPDTERSWQRFLVKTKLREKPAGFPWMKVAAAVALLFVASFVVVNFTQREELIEITSVSGVKHVELPDGSEIWLNDSSTISYSEDFSVDNREVFLFGEAFFEVKKAEGKRFTVFTADTKTEVIGTSFNVQAREGRPVKVQVATGKVAFALKENANSIFLKPGEEGIVKEDSLMSRKIENLNFRSWQDQRLFFNNTNLLQLVQTLESHFNVNIFIASEELHNCRFTVSFNQQELDKILKVIAITGNLKVENHEKGYVISGEGCK